MTVSTRVLFVYLQKVAQVRLFQRHEWERRIMGCLEQSTGADAGRRTVGVSIGRGKICARGSFICPATRAAVPSLQYTLPWNLEVNPP